jgi:hypothetical protein
MTTLRCYQVSKLDKYIKTIYLEELADANLVTTDQCARMKVGDRVVLSVKAKGCKNPCDLVFRMNRNLSTLTTTAWNPLLGEPKVGNRDACADGEPVVLKVLGHDLLMDL